jgi:hypothetical protein
MGRAAAAISLALARLVMSACGIFQAVCLAARTVIHSLAIANCPVLNVGSQSDLGLFIIESPSQFVPQEALLSPGGVLFTDFVSKPENCIFMPKDTSRSLKTTGCRL